MEETQTVRRTTAPRQMCLDSRIHETDTLPAGDREHGIVLGHAGGNPERVLLEVCHMIDGDALRLAHNERVARDSGAVGVHQSTVESGTGEIVRARDLDHIVSDGRKRSGGTAGCGYTLGLCRARIDVALIDTAVDVHLILLGDGFCVCCSSRFGKGFAAVDLSVVCTPVQVEDVLRCRCGRPIALCLSRCKTAVQPTFDDTRIHQDLVLCSSCLCHAVACDIRVRCRAAATG